VLLRSICAQECENAVKRMMPGLAAVVDPGGSVLAVLRRLP
jgi:hypothetical protein